jgi:hypothetical protein
MPDDAGHGDAAAYCRVTVAAAQVSPAGHRRPLIAIAGR